MQGEGTLVAPSRVKSRVTAGIYNEEAQSRRNSEPYYVNLPVRDAAASVNCNNETTDNNTDTLRVNNKNFQSSVEQQNSKAAEACDNGLCLLTVACSFTLCSFMLTCSNSTLICTRTHTFRHAHSHLSTHVQ